MIAVIFATSKEAVPFLEAVGAVARPGSTDLYQDRGKTLMVGICGMGPHKAAAFTHRLLDRQSFREVINAGIAGALRDGGHFQSGAIFQIGRAFTTEGSATDGAIRPHCGSPWQHLPTADLVTVAVPVFGGQRRAALSRKADLVDMEGAMVARTTLAAGLPCRLLKVVSDNASFEGRPQLQANLSRVCRRLAEYLVQGIPQLNRSN